MVALMGTIANMQMDVKDARFYVSEIQRHLAAATEHVNSARGLIWELHERQGWKALGYASWGECVKSEFDITSSTIYRQLNAALVELELSPNGGIGEISERVLRPLTRRSYSIEARQAIWSVAQDIVGDGGKVTTGVVEAVVEGLKDMLVSGTTQDGDGNQHPITERMHADLVARVREKKLQHKQHINRMDKKRDYILGGREARNTARSTVNGLSCVLLQAELCDALEIDKLSQAMRSGKQIYCALWTE